MHRLLQAYDRDGEDGLVSKKRGRPSNRRTHSQIDMDERRKIARWRTAGISVDVIAEKLGRHRSTIFRELRRNAFTDSQMPELNGYYCVTANDMARDRRAKLRKLARFSHLRQSVIERIMHGWSPQQIAGRLQLERHPICVSHETIYKFAYSPDGHAIKLWRHLPEHRARRRPRHARRRHGRRFSPEVNILFRPDVVAERKQFGHCRAQTVRALMVWIPLLGRTEIEHTAAEARL
jgi:IS30 family transposase